MTAPIRSPCSSARLRRGFRNWCLSAMDGCWPLRLRSTGAQPLSWPADLAMTPVSGLLVQLCGDAHLSNFGIFGTPERRIIFDINDFDETASGAMGVGCQAYGGEPRGCRRARTATPPRMRRESSATTARSYRSGHDASSPPRRNLEVFYAQPRLGYRYRLGRAPGGSPPRKMRKRAENVAKARTRDNMQALGKLMPHVDGQPRIAATHRLSSRSRSFCRRRPRHDVKSGRTRAARATGRPLEHRAAACCSEGYTFVDTRAQGRRRRQCRHALLDRLDARSRR